MTRSVLLDLLRIIAITLVFIAHFGQTLDHWTGDFFGIKNFFYVSLGGVGVSMFIILSGLLAGLMEMDRPANFITYFFKKVLRIYPLYWLSLILAVIGYLMNGLLMKGQLLSPFPNGFMADVLGSLTGFYAWMGLWGGPYNPPSWFIVLIMSLYGCFPFLAWCFRRWQHYTLAVLFILSAFSRWYIGQYGVPFVSTSWLGEVESWAYRLYGFMPGRPGDWFLLCRIFEFGLGIWLALTIKQQVWLALNGLSSKLNAGIAWLSDLSFALFLVHYPYLFLTIWLKQMGMPIFLSILIVLALIFVMAIQIQKFDGHFPRKRWLSRLTK